MYLLDTNVLSARAPTKAVRDEAILAWMQGASERLYLSVVTALEVEKGIERLRRSGSERKAAALNEWWVAIEEEYGARLLPLDLAAARAAGRIADRARAFSPDFRDVAAAATAETRGLVVITFNQRHFESLGVEFLNPLNGLPDHSRS